VGGLVRKHTLPAAPKGNQRDCDELSANICNGMLMYFVSHYRDVARVVYPG
jgi:ATP-dependent Lon protease